MKHTLHFKSIVGFNYATVITDLETFTPESAIDVDNNLIWVDDIETASKLFDDAGVDNTDYKIVETPKSAYNALLARLAKAEKEKQVQELLKQNEQLVDSDNNE